MKELLNESTSLSLFEILDQYPPKDGMLEVIGYIMVALEDPRHIVTDDESETVTIPGSKPSTWKVPKVIFCR